MGGGRGGSKRLRGDGGRLKETKFWNIRDCGTLRPDQDLGLRRQRWVVRRASGLNGVIPFFPPRTYLLGSGAMSLRMWVLFLSRFLLVFFSPLE